jgi:PAS domain S-box-containing protein
MKTENSKKPFADGALSDRVKHVRTNPEIALLNKKLQKFQHLFDHAPIGRFAINFEGRIEALNFAAASMLGLDRDEAHGCRLADHVRQDDKAAFDQFLEMILEIGASPPCEVGLINRAGGSVFVILSALKLPDENLIHFAATDISNLHQARHELKRSREDSDSKIQARTGRLRSLARELTLAEERERRRIAGLVHDNLQQLLVAVLLNIGATKPKTKSERVLEELDSIERMTKECIQITRSLTSELSPTVLHQSGLAAGFGWLCDWFWEKYGFSLEVDADKSFMPDEDISITLFQCVREIVFNAVKHSTVKVAQLTMACDGDGFFKISIRDQGAGFDVDALMSQETWKGGFGLFSVRERVELLGGEMLIESAPGQGSCFTFRFPAKLLNVSCNGDRDQNPNSVAEELTEARHEMVRTRKRAEMSQGTGSDLPRYRVILADDHSMVRQGLVRVFCDEEDFEVVGEAANGKEALELARELDPDIIVMDLQMPVMSGLEATRLIRKELPGVQVIGLSMDSGKESRRSLRRAGALDLLHKGGSAEDLIERVREHLAAKAPVADA